MAASAGLEEYREGGLDQLAKPCEEAAWAAGLGGSLQLVAGTLARAVCLVYWLYCFLKYDRQQQFSSFSQQQVISRDGWMVVSVDNTKVSVEQR